MKINGYEGKVLLQEVLDLAIRHLTPKSKANASLVLQATVEIDGREFILRSNAPNNYRKVYWKLTSQDINHLLEGQHGPFWKERIKGGWVLLADHDSCWTDGLRPSKLIDKYEMIDLKKIELLRANVVDYRVDMLKDSLSVEKTIDFSDKNYFETVTEILKSMYQNADTLEFEFEKDRSGKRKTFRVLANDLLEVEASGKTIDFSAKAIQKELKSDSYRLWPYITHRRENVYFS